MKKSSGGAHLARHGEENREDGHRRWGQAPRGADGVAQAKGMDAGAQQEDEDAGAGLGEETDELDLLRRRHRSPPLSFAFVPSPACPNRAITRSFTGSFTRATHLPPCLPPGR